MLSELPAHNRVESFIRLQSGCRANLPSGIVVSEVDKVLHEPGVDLAQSQTLVWRLQNGLGTGRNRNETLAGQLQNVLGNGWAWSEERWVWPWEQKEAREGQSSIEETQNSC